MRKSTSCWMRGIAAAVAMTWAIGNGATAQDTEGWVSQAAVGVNLTDGNSETKQLTIDFNGQRTEKPNEVIVGAGYAYGESAREGDDKTIDNGKAFGQYNRFMTENSYGFLRTEYSTDDIADVDYRVKVSPGMGYYLLQDEKNSIAMELWPAWVAEKVGGETDDAIVLRFAERGDHKLGDAVRVFHSLEYLPEFEDFGSYLLSGELGVDSSMSARLSLRVVLKDAYDSEPAVGRDKNDLTLTAGVVYKL